MKSFTVLALFALVSTSAVAEGRRTLQPPVQLVPANPNLTDDQVKSQVRAYLGTIEIAISPARWRALGPRAEAPLLAVVGGAVLPTRRAKALDGLSSIGTSHIEIFRTISANEAEPFVVRYAALRGLGALLPQPEMIAALTPVLNSAKDARVRAAAGAVLGQRAPSACAEVKAQIRREAPADRDQFGRAMDLCFAR